MQFHVHHEGDEDDGVSDVVLVNEYGLPETGEDQRQCERAMQDLLFYDAHRAHILATYADQWVAICQEQVIAAAEVLHDLLSWLDANGVPRERALIQYVCQDDDDLVICWP